jgi:hypothetical protein
MGFGIRGHDRGLRICSPRPATKPTTEVRPTNKSTHKRPSSRGLSPTKRKRCVEASVSDLLQPTTNQLTIVTATAPPKPHQTERLKAMTCEADPVRPNYELRISNYHLQIVPLASFCKGGKLIQLG